MASAWRNRTFVALTVLLVSLLLWRPVQSTKEDVHVFHGEGEMSPSKLLKKYPILVDIMEKEKSSVIPVDTIIASHPKLWKELQ